MTEPQLFSQLPDDEKIRVHLKAALRLMREKKARIQLKLEDIRTGALYEPGVQRDYEDLLEQYSHVLQNVGLLESIIIYS